MIWKLAALAVLAVVFTVALWRVSRFMGKDRRKAQKSGIAALAAIIGLVMVGGNGWSVSCFAPLAGIAVLTASLWRFGDA